MAGIYIHIPFCKQACHYCDFHFSTSLKNKQELIDALKKELELRKSEIEEPISTIYFGGGTPSLLDTEEVQDILDLISINYKVVETPEITLEANPDDLSLTKIIELSKVVNRLSIGVQSFFDEDLKMMNRAHTAHESEMCLKNAKQYFDNITIDLIYGIPDLTEDRWRKNLQKAFDLDIPHISSYALTVEHKTALEHFIEKGKYPPIDENLAAEHFNILISEVQKQGFVQYEISNFGKPDYFSKHNTSYWEGEQYLGVGPSAHSFNGKTRSWNVSNNAKYIKSIEQNELPSEVEVLSQDNRFNEYIMTRLRTIWGIDLKVVEQEFGVDYLNHILSNVQIFEKQSLLLNEEGVIKATDKGKFLVDGIAAELFVI